MSFYLFTLQNKLLFWCFIVNKCSLTTLLKLHKLFYFFKNQWISVDTNLCGMPDCVYTGVLWSQVRLPCCCPSAIWTRHITIISLCQNCDFFLAESRAYHFLSHSSWGAEIVDGRQDLGTQGGSTEYSCRVIILILLHLIVFNSSGIWQLLRVDWDRRKLAQWRNYYY